MGEGRACVHVHVCAGAGSRGGGARAGAAGLLSRSRRRCWRAPPPRSPQVGSPAPPPPAPTLGLHTRAVVGEAPVLAQRAEQHREQAGLQLRGAGGWGGAGGEAREQRAGSSILVRAGSRWGGWCRQRSGRASAKDARSIWRTSSVLRNSTTPLGWALTNSASAFCARMEGEGVGVVCGWGGGGGRGWGGAATGRGVRAAPPSPAARPCLAPASRWQCPAGSQAARRAQARRWRRRRTRGRRTCRECRWPACVCGGGAGW